MAVSLFSPAKINLFLAVTGRRGDGFHDLVSVVAPLDFGDELTVEPRDRPADDRGRFSLECNQADVPVDGSNLVLKAAAAFALATGFQGTGHFKLTKRIPLGAGLGGGSSNAVAALRVMNQLAGGIAGEDELARIAAGLGSDCVLFLQGVPLVMRGRGEQVEALAGAARDRLRGRRVLLFKPGFGIGTAWAYGRMAARGTDYLVATEAEARLHRWLAGATPVEELLFNNMEGVAFEKYPALLVLLGQLRAEFRVAARMSGSGSACYALLGDQQAAAPLIERIRADWGDSAFVQEARIV